MTVKDDTNKYNIVNGEYNIGILGVDASITGAQINFKGCNIVNIPYKIDPTGGIKFGE